MTTSLLPSRGDIWIADLKPSTGHEQGGAPRPCLVLSVDSFNHGLAELVVVLPLTTSDRKIPLRIRVNPPEGGLRKISYIMPEMIRSISTSRLTARLGTVSTETMERAEEYVGILLGMG
jgi:mRNA interferase MazF